MTRRSDADNPAEVTYVGSTKDFFVLRDGEIIRVDTMIDEVGEVTSNTDAAHVLIGQSRDGRWINVNLWAFNNGVVQ